METYTAVRLAVRAWGGSGGRGMRLGRHALWDPEFEILTVPGASPTMTY